MIEAFFVLRVLGVYLVIVQENIVKRKERKSPIIIYNRSLIVVYMT